MPWKVIQGDPYRQGITRTEKGFNFAIRVPDGKEASLLLYKKGSNKVEYEIPLPDEERTGEVSAVKLEPMEAGKWEYNYRLDGEVKPDVYTRSLRGREPFGSPMGEKKAEHLIRGVLPEKPVMETEPLCIPYEDSIFYKTHVRGFTKQKGSGVRNKGTFAGVEEKIPYLKKLGITALELMPVYEFFEVPCVEELRLNYRMDPMTPVLNYWGYGPALYFAPKSSFAATSDPNAEFAHMVDSLHKAGIECILEFYFPPNTNSGLVLDALRHWMLTFKVDGFHLLGEGNWVSLVADDPLLKKTKLLFLGYDTSQIYGENKRPNYRNLAEHNLSFQQDMRRYLKGDEGCVETAAYRLRRNPAACGQINFFADHDGFTMADMVTYEQKHNEENGEDNRDGSSLNYSWNCGIEGPTRKRTVSKLREKQLRNAWLMLMTAQGTPMIYAGDERCNTTKGNNNSYCQDNEVGWVDWNKNRSNLRMLEFVKSCIAFRKAHPVLHMREEPRLMDYKSYGAPDLSYHGERAWFAQMEYNSRVLGAMLCGDYGRKQDGTADESLYIACNMHWDPHEVALPTLKDKKIWKVAADADSEQGFYPPGEEAELSSQRKIMIPPRTVMVLIAVAPSPAVEVLESK